MPPESHNPQTWNRNAYVTNNPASMVDPSGLFMTTPCYGCGGPGGAVGYYGAGDACTVDSAPCLQSGMTGVLGFNGMVNCPQCKPGQLVDAANQIWQYQADFYRKNCSGPVSGAVAGALGHCTTTFAGSGIMNVGALTGVGGGLPNGDVPLNPYAQSVLSHPILQTAASTMTDARTYALWGGGATIEGLLLVPGAGAAVSSSIYDPWLGFEYAFPGATADIIQMLTPPSSIPSTLPGAVAFSGEQIYDSYQNQY